MGDRKLLGDFLRARRHRLDPLKLGMSDARRRRTQGLRREEVAERAGISSEWYIKLEQGRDVSPSPETVEALGRALQLSHVELAHLRSLAAGSGERQPFEREPLSETLRAIVAAYPGPAYLTGQRWDVLAFNDAAAALFGDFARRPLEQQNVLHWMLIDPAAKALFQDAWEEEARRMVSLFRSAHDLWPGDAQFVSLVDQVRESCSAFEAWWAEHSVGAPVSGTKHLCHPLLGFVQYNYASFQANDDPAIKLVIYVEV